MLGSDLVLGCSCLTIMSVPPVEVDREKRASAAAGKSKSVDVGDAGARAGVKRNVAAAALDVVVKSVSGVMASIGWVQQQPLSSSSSATAVPPAPSRPKLSSEERQGRRSTLASAASPFKPFTRLNQPDRFVLEDEHGAFVAHTQPVEDVRAAAQEARAAAESMKNLELRVMKQAARGEFFTSGCTCPYSDSESGCVIAAKRGGSNQLYLRRSEKSVHDDSILACGGIVPTDVPGEWRPCGFAAHWDCMRNAQSMAAVTEGRVMRYCSPRCPYGSIGTGRNHVMLPLTEESIQIAKHSSVIVDVPSSPQQSPDRRPAATRRRSRHRQPALAAATGHTTSTAVADASNDHVDTSTVNADVVVITDGNISTNNSAQVAERNDDDLEEVWHECPSSPLASASSPGLPLPELPQLHVFVPQQQQQVDDADDEGDGDVFYDALEHHDDEQNQDNEVLQALFAMVGSIQPPADGAMRAMHDFFMRVEGDKRARTE